VGLIESEHSHHPFSTSVTGAYWYLEEICTQVEAIRKLAKGAVANSVGLFREHKLKVSNYSDEYDSSSGESTWIYRSCIDTFDLVPLKGEKAKYRCGIQYSIAPKDRLNKDFFPHVALLFGDAKECDIWDCDEFMLDEAALNTLDEDVGYYPWRRTHNLRWIEDEDEVWVARVIPLRWLTNESDITNHLVGALLEEIRYFSRTR